MFLWLFLCFTVKLQKCCVALIWHFSWSMLKYLNKVVEEKPLSCRREEAAGRNQPEAFWILRLDVLKYSDLNEDKEFTLCNITLYYIVLYYIILYCIILHYIVCWKHVNLLYRLMSCFVASLTWICVTWCVFSWVRWMPPIGWGHYRELKPRPSCFPHGELFFRKVLSYFHHSFWPLKVCFIYLFIY